MSLPEAEKYVRVGQLMDLHSKTRLYRMLNIKGTVPVRIGLSQLFDSDLPKEQYYLHWQKVYTSLLFDAASQFVLDCGIITYQKAQAFCLSPIVEGISKHLNQSLPTMGLLAIAPYLIHTPSNTYKLAMELDDVHDCVLLHGLLRTGKGEQDRNITESLYRDFYQNGLHGTSQYPAILTFLKSLNRELAVQYRDYIIDAVPTSGFNSIAMDIIMLGTNLSREATGSAFRGSLESLSDVNNPGRLVEYADSIQQVIVNLTGDYEINKS